MEDWLKNAMDKTKEELEELKGEENDRETNK